MFLTVLFLSLLASTVWAKDIVRVSVFNFPPHVFSENKSIPVGPGVEFIQTYLFPEDQWDLQWRTTDFARILEDLKNNKTDVALYYSKTPDRQKIVEYSRVPLTTTTSAVIVKTNSSLDLSKEIPRGLRLSRNIGTIVPASFTKAKVVFEELRGEDIFNRSIHLLRTDRIQGYYIPTMLNATFELSRHKLNSEFKVLEVPGQSLELYVVYRKGLSPKIIQTLNDNLEKHRDQYPKLMQKRYPVLQVEAQKLASFAY